MSDKRHVRAKEVFLEARKLAPEQRAAYLKDVCGEDTALERDVRSLANDSGTELIPATSR